jgi:hypothetical protein
MRTWIVWLALALAVGVHGVNLAGPVWAKVRDAGHARDFASYYYAAQAASADQNPYDTRVLGRLARQDGTRKSVHPYFYPPPYLLTVAWTLPLELSTAYRTWFVLDTLFLLAVFLAIRLWFPGRGPVLGMALILVTFTPIPDNHWMGQANLPVLALVCWALWLQFRGRLLAAGALMGLASMMKMSPGLFVVWWFLDRRTRPAAWWACATAALLSLATLPLLDLQGQWHFFSEVLPGFGTGDYNGLTVPVTLSGNHSIANLWAQIFPGGAHLSDRAQRASSATNLVLLATVLALLVRAQQRRPLDALGHACGAGALACCMIVVPAYAYEHHLVFLILPLLAVSQALTVGRLGRLWGLGVLPAYVALSWNLGSIRAAMREVPGGAAWWLQESKFLGIAILGTACLVAALRPPTDSRRVEVPGSGPGPASTTAIAPGIPTPVGGPSDL